MHARAPIIFVALLVLALGAIILIAIGAQRRRERVKARSFQELASEFGLTYEAKAPRGFRDEWTILPQIPKQGDVAHLMYGEIDGAPVTFFRHRYVVSTGQATSVIVHWVFVTEAPNWPELHLKRRGAIRRLLGARSAVTDDDRFNRDWYIKTTDQAFARALLNPRVRAFLDEPRHAPGRKVREMWHVLGGKLCCVTRTSAGESLLRTQAARVLTMRTLISGEPAQAPHTGERQLIGSDA